MIIPTKQRMEQAAALAHEYAELHARGDYGGRDDEIIRTIDDLVGGWVWDRTQHQHRWALPVEIKRILLGKVTP